MKAIIYTAFGNSDVIKITEKEKPNFEDDEVLIKSSAVSINPADIKYRKGLMQQRLPIELPYTPGLDVAGIIVAVGKNVSRLNVGDKVFGGKHGNTYAEYVTLKENVTSVIPSNISFFEAAALVVPLVTSYSFLIEAAEIKKGQRIFIQGITGGTGQIMLQMAKSLGLYAIGTGSASGLEVMKSLGADEVIDYKNPELISLVKDIDIVIDLVGGETQLSSFKTLGGSFSNVNSRTLFLKSSKVIVFLSISSSLS